MKVLSSKTLLVVQNGVWLIDLAFVELNRCCWRPVSGERQEAGRRSPRIADEFSRILVVIVLAFEDRTACDEFQSQRRV